MRIPTRLVIFILCLVFASAQAGQAKSPRVRHDPAKPNPPETTPLQTNITDLNSPDVERRRQAAEALAQDASPHALPALVRALSDEDAAVRASAARALGAIRSPDALKDLVRVLETDPDAETRRQAAMSLGFIGGAEGQEPLIRALKDKDAGPRLAAVRALAVMKAKKAAPALRECLADKSPEFRRTAAEALGEIKDPASAPRLRALLKDKDLSVKTAAVTALGKMRDRDSLPPVRKFLTPKNPPGLRVAAAQALGRIGSAEGRPAALEILQNTSVSGAVRVQAVRALAELADPSLLDPVKTVAEAEPEGDVKRAANALAEKLQIQRKEDGSQ